MVRFGLGSSCITVFLTTCRKNTLTEGGYFGARCGLEGFRVSSRVVEFLSSDCSLGGLRRKVGVGAWTGCALYSSVLYRHVASASAAQSGFVTNRRDAKPAKRGAQAPCSSWHQQHAVLLTRSSRASSASGWRLTDVECQPRKQSDGLPRH